MSLVIPVSTPMTRTLVLIDKIYDYVPFVSTVSNAIDIIAKSILCLAGKEASTNNYYFAHLKNKNFLRCFTLLIPGIGNFIITIYDLANRNKQVASSPSDKNNLPTDPSSYSQQTSIPVSYADGSPPPQYSVRNPANTSFQPPVYTHYTEAPLFNYSNMHTPLNYNQINNPNTPLGKPQTPTQPVYGPPFQSTQSPIPLNTSNTPIRIIPASPPRVVNGTSQPMQQVTYITTQGPNNLSTRQIPGSIQGPIRLQPEPNLMPLVPQAIALLEGKTVPKDPQKAILLLDQAGRDGDSNGYLILGKLYRNGGDVLSDPYLAFKNFLKAEEMGNEHATRHLAHCYIEGIGTEINKKLGADLLHKAGDRGDYDALAGFGNCLLNGCGREINEERAIHILNKALENGSKLAVETIARCYINGMGVRKNREKGLAMIHDLANIDRYPPAFFHLGILQQIGDIIPKNPQGAFTCFKDAAALGYRPANINLAWCYINGYGAPINLNEAIKILTKMAGDPLADYNLGVIYYNMPPSPQNYQTAINLIQSAADKNEPNAKNFLKSLRTYPNKHF